MDKLTGIRQALRPSWVRWIAPTWVRPPHTHTPTSHCGACRNQLFPILSRFSSPASLFCCPCIQVFKSLPTEEPRMQKPKNSSVFRHKNRRETKKNERREK